MPLDVLLLWVAIAINTGLALWALARTRRLETTMDDRLAAIDRKLETLPALATKQDIINASQETMTQVLLSLGLRPPAFTAIGTIQTGGGGAAVGGSVSDQRKDP